MSAGSLRARPSDVRARVGHRHLVGQGAPRERGAHGRARHDDDRLETVGRLEADDVAAGDDDEAAQQRGGRVVGMALELGRVREQVGIELEHVGGRDEPGDVGRGAGPEPAGERHLRADAKREAVGRVQPREPADAEVAPVARDVELRLDGEAAGLGDLELDVQRERRGEDVEARPEVRRRGGHAHEPAAVHQEPPRTASSTAARFGSQAMTPPALSSAVCGSFRPWPVRTQATRRAPSAP